MTDARGASGPTIPGTPASGPALDAVAALVPAPLAMFGDRLAAGPGGPTARPAATLRERAVFDAAIDAFGAGHGRSDWRAVVSYWSQFYLAALVIPALTALACLDRALPLALDEVGFELDEAGRLARFLVPEAGAARTGDDAPAAGLAALVDGHLRPFVELCHAHSGLARRVLWGNAAVILDRTAEELGAVAAAAPVLAEAGTLLGWRAGRDAPTGPLAHTLRAVGPGGGTPWGGRCRRVCCLRYRLPGVVDCGALCPVVRRPGTARADRSR